MNQPTILKRNNTPTKAGNYIGAKSTVHRCEVVFAYESESGFRFNDGDSEYGVEVYEFWSDRIDIEFEFEESEPVKGLKTKTGTVLGGRESVFVLEDNGGPVVLKQGSQVEYLDVKENEFVYKDIRKESEPVKDPPIMEKLEAMGDKLDGDCDILHGVMPHNSVPRSCDPHWGEESKPVKDHIPDATKMVPPCKECGGDYPCPCYGLQPEKSAVPEQPLTYSGKVSTVGTKHFQVVCENINGVREGDIATVVLSVPEPQPIEIEANQTWRFKKGGKEVKTVDAGNDLWLISDERGKACKIGGCYLVKKEGLHRHLNEHAEFVPEETA